MLSVAVITKTDLRIKGDDQKRVGFAITPHTPLPRYQGGSKVVWEIRFRWYQEISVDLSVILRMMPVFHTVKLACARKLSLHVVQTRSIFSRTTNTALSSCPFT